MHPARACKAGRLRLARLRGNSTVTEFEFRQMVDRLFVKRRSDITGVLHGAVGLSGEAGEILDLVKKSWAYGKPIDCDKLIEEMGDALHYMTMLCIKLDVTFGDLMAANKRKLDKRYPNGYSDKAAIARADMKPSKRAKRKARK